MSSSQSSSQSDSVPEGQAFFDLFYVGINIESILYGIVLVLYFQTIHVFLNNRKALKRSNLFYVLFSSMMVFLITVWVATQAFFGQKMWLIDADFPGGQSAYWKTYIAVWYVDWGSTAIVILQLMSDGLMIYRCRIIWNSYRIVIAPILLWLVTFVLGVADQWITCLPGGDFFTGVAVQVSLAYWSVSGSLTVILTCMICYRVLRHGWTVRQHLGHEYASLYISIATIVVESVLPYTLTGVSLVVSLGSGSPTSVMFVNVYPMMMCISPQMLILRVMAGEAWGNETFNRSGSTLKFSPDSVDATTSGLQWLESRGTKEGVQTLSNVHLPEGRRKVRFSEV